MIDIHAHLTNEKFEGKLKKLNQELKKYKIKVICAGLNFEDNNNVLKICSKYETFFPALGFYPSIVEKEDWKNELKKVIEQIRKNNIVAISEVGIDYKINKKKEEQKIAFKKMIELAIELKLPLIMHSRWAVKRVINILSEYQKEIKEEKLIPIFHAFGGNEREVMEAWELGCYFSIPTSVEKIPQKQVLAELVPTNKLFLETDSPYMGLKERINTPLNILRSVMKIAEIKRIPAEKLIIEIEKNEKKIFKKIS